MAKRFPKNKWFTLPWLGPDVYSQLMHAGVKHDKRFGFKITQETEISEALSIISSALHEEATVEQYCFVCERPIDGLGNTLCKECFESDDAYEHYTMRFASLMDGGQNKD